MIALLPFGLLCLLSLVLAWIDIRNGIIPDWLNLAIAGLGLSKTLIVAGPLVGLQAACEGAAIGATFWLLRRLYFAFRKIQGLGLGDVKFLTAAGIWVGVAGLPMLLLVAALTALGLRRHHAIGGTAIDRSDVDIVRTVSRDRSFVHVGLSTTLVVLLNERLSEGALSARGCDVTDRAFQQFRRRRRWTDLVANLVTRRRSHSRAAAIRA